MKYSIYASYICWPNIAQKVKLDSRVIRVIIIVNITKDPWSIGVLARPFIDFVF